MSDRKLLNEEGMISIAIAINSKNNTIIVPPKCYARGLIHQGNPEMLNECAAAVEAKVRETLNTKTNYSEIKFVIKQAATEYIYSKTKRCPMIIPVVMSKVD